MSEFNDNNGQNEVSDIPVSEIKPEEHQPAKAVEPIMAGTEIISGVEKAKKGPAAVIAVIAVILVLLLGGSAVAYSFSPWVKNNVKMIINDPEDYYSWVENQNIKESAEKVAEAYDKGADTFLKANGQTDGTKSYGRMVDLLLAEYRSQTE